MYFNKLLLICCAIIVSCIDVSLSQKVEYQFLSLPGNCPNDIKVVSNVNYTAVKGAWYIQYVSYNGSQFGCDESCWTIYLSQIEPNRLSACVCCLNAGEPFCGAELGSGFIRYSDLAPSYHDYENNGANSPGVIIDVNYSPYDGYWIAYVCSTLPDGTVQDLLFVLTRQPNPSSTFDSFVRRTFQNAGIGIQSLIKLDHHLLCLYPFGCCG